MGPVGPLAGIQRDGVDTIIKLAKTLCRIVGVFSPTIRSKWANNGQIISLLDAVEALCPLIQPAADSQYEWETGGNNSVPDTNPEDVPGKIS